MRFKNLLLVLAIAAGANAIFVGLIAANTIAKLKFRVRMWCKNLLLVLAIAAGANAILVGLTAA